MIHRVSAKQTLNTALAAAALVLVLVTAACKKQEPPTVDPGAGANPEAVTVTKELASRLKIGRLEKHDVADSLQVPGRVETDGTRIARIGSPVSGRILTLLALEGQAVRRGQTLATLHSNDLSDAQFSFVKAFSQRKLAEQSAKRAELLVEADVIGKAELERRQAEVLQATAGVDALGAQLRGLGMTDEKIHHLETSRKLNADYPIVSSISGTILERKITVGQVVQPAEEAFQVADLSVVWLVADVPEEHAGNLHGGMRVEAKILALQNQTIQGHLSYIAPIVDPATRTIQVRMNLNNPRGAYKPAMLAQMTFVDRTESKICVPENAIVREENKDHVFVQVAPNQFVLREVVLGGEGADERVLMSGLQPGESIVLDGAFHLNNQRKQHAIQGSK